jgi:hypothetical protein
MGCLQESGDDMSYASRTSSHVFSHNHLTSAYGRWACPGLVRIEGGGLRRDGTSLSVTHRRGSVKGARGVQIEQTSTDSESKGLSHT